MRHAFMAASIAFHPTLAWTRKPVRWISRPAARALMNWLDRRRALLDGNSVIFPPADEKTQQ